MPASFVTTAHYKVPCTTERKGAIVVVDPYSTGAAVSLEFANRGYAVIALWTADAGDLRHHTPDFVPASLYTAEVVQDGETASELADKLREAVPGDFIAEVVCGGETGVKITDAVSEIMGLRTNGTAGGMENRRDKSVQQEAARASGVRACREACGKTWASVSSFCDQESMPVVVKPVAGAGSEGVKLCHTAEEARAHFDTLMTAQLRAGEVGAAVLVQEFLQGCEYVVDHVSRGGVHKATMLWKYDKRAANGSAFVYYNMVPVPCDSEQARSLIAYTRAVLDAIRFTNGATHTELIMTADGPCLVEVNCRCHGGNGAWLPLASALTGGITQVSALVDAFTNEAAFERMPDAPAAFRAGGCNPMFVSHRTGHVISRPGYERIKAMRSCVSLDESVGVGAELGRTVDLFTACGQAVLAHEDPQVVADDLAAIRAMERDGSMFYLVADVVVADDAPISTPKTSKARRRERCSTEGLSELSESSLNSLNQRIAAAAA